MILFLHVVLIYFFLLGGEGIEVVVNGHLHPISIVKEISSLPMHCHENGYYEYEESNTSGPLVYNSPDASLCTKLHG